jgi:pimeloyl-ACP methyl ester carboxylesterase
MWQPQLDALGSRFHVLAPDLPGMAQSSQVGRFTIAGAAAAIAKLIEEHHGRPAHVCGLSLGAMVGLATAIEFPRCIDDLVVSGAQVRPHRLIVALQTAAMGIVPSSRLLASIASSMPGGRTDIADAAREDLSKTGKRGLLSAMREAGTADFRTTLPQVQSRTLVLCGRRDRVNRGAARSIAAAVPNAALELVPNVGHVWNLEAPELFNEILESFLKGTGE